MQPSVRASVQVAQEISVSCLEAVERPVLTSFFLYTQTQKTKKRPWPALLSISRCLLFQHCLDQHCGLLPTLRTAVWQLRGLPSSVSEAKPRSSLLKETIPWGTKGD